MREPTTALHEKSYAEDWIAWVKWRISQNKWEDGKQAVRTIMKETNGRINPKWISGFVCPACSGTGAFVDSYFQEECRNCHGQGFFSEYNNREVEE